MSYNQVCFTQCRWGLVTLKVTGTRGLLWGLRSFGGRSLSSAVVPEWPRPPHQTPSSSRILDLLLSWLFPLNLQILQFPPILCEPGFYTDYLLLHCSLLFLSPPHLSEISASLSGKPASELLGTFLQMLQDSAQMTPAP